MSEREPKYESGSTPEFDPKESEKLKDALAEKLGEEAEKAEAKQESLEKIRENIEKTAASKKEIEHSRSETVASESVLKAGGQLKNIAFKQKMRDVQRKEKPAERRFSRIIHQPVVEEISNLAEGTVARPSGLLFGGIFSVLSSLLVLYIARHYGYEYNFLVGIVSFAGGFALGLLLEGLWRVFHKA